MRTDSLNLADQFLTEAQKFIKEKFGAAYALGPKKYQAKSKLAQEAHEAIRPTDPFLTPEKVKPYLDSRQAKLYDLIWRRSLASQMPPAKVANTAIDLTDAHKHLFRATGSVVVFAGFLKVLPHENNKEILPALKEGEAVKTEKIEPLQHFTEPPARYSEASLIKALEEYGIGRPSTYAPTIATIQSRAYVTSEEKKLKPTEIGFIVNDLLVEHFPKIVDYQFTAKIEDDFDRIAEGQEDWAKMLKDFYLPFHELVLEKQGSVSKETSTATRELGLDPESGKPIFVRIGRFGPFVQKGSAEGEIKPTFASLKNGQSMDSVTLNDALELFKLPRNLGQDPSGETVIVNRGRFGPYVKIGSNNFSIKNEDPYTITLDKVLSLIAGQRERKAKQTLKIFPNSDVKVLNGRYGPYITDGALNCKLPPKTEPADLTLEQCQELLAASPVKKARRSFTKKPAA